MSLPSAMANGLLLSVAAAMAAAGVTVPSRAPSGETATARWATSRPSRSPEASFPADTQMRCDECHGLPPATGAHPDHADRDGYRVGFDCSTCHYVDRFPDLHDDGRVDIRFAPPLLERGDARYQEGSCVDVYCHSDGRGEGRPVRWSEEVDLGCDGCHPDATSIEIDMSGQHAFHLNSGVECASCHASVASVAGIVVGHQEHADGDVDLGVLAGEYDPATRNCTNGCHEDRVWRDDR